MEKWGKRSHVILLISLILLTFSALTANAAKISAGEMLPDLKIEKLDAGEVSLKKELGKQNSLLVFFNTSCNKCRQEIVWLLENHIDKNLLFIGIDLRGAEAIKLYRDRYLQKFDPASINMYVDSQFEVAGMLGLSYTPSVAMVDKEGKLIKTLAGYSDKVKGELNNFLK